jgi:transposase
VINRSINRQYRWKVKSRLAVLEYAAIHGVKPTATRFGIDRKTIRTWRTRAQEAGPAGLVPRYPKRRARRIGAEVVELIRSRPTRVAIRGVPDPHLATAGPSGQGGD